MAGFSFFDNKEPPKLPVTPGSRFGSSLGNMPCFTFVAPKNTSSSSNNKIFTFGFNPVKQPETNFDIKMDELSRSLSSISNQPLSISLTKNKSVSERTKRISSLENALAEIQSFKDKVSNMESNIAKLLMDELDSIKENVSGCINPFSNSMQIVEQKSVSTSPTQKFEFQQPTLFPFGCPPNPNIKPKPKLFANFKPQSVNTPLVFNASSVCVSGSSDSTPAVGSAIADPLNVSSDVAPVSGGNVSAPISGGNASAPISGGNASAPIGGGNAPVPANSVNIFGVAPTVAAVTTNENTLYM